MSVHGDDDRTREHLQSCSIFNSMPCDCKPPELSASEHLAAVKRDATVLAETLRAASDDGVSHALILPQLVRVFREAFGEMPAGFTLPGMGQ